MSISRRDERSLLTHDEQQIVDASRHPQPDSLELTELRDLRALRDKERGLAGHKARVVRGKAEACGDSFPGTAERPKPAPMLIACAVRHHG